MDICPACAEGHLVEDLSDFSYAHQGKKNVIKDVRGQRCPVCNEIFMDAAEAQRVSDDMAAFRKKC